jgi:hypothetical protein
MSLVSAGLVVRYPISRWSSASQGFPDRLTGLEMTYQLKTTYWFALLLFQSVSLAYLINHDELKRLSTCTWIWIWSRSARTLS